MLYAPKISPFIATTRLTIAFQYLDSYSPMVVILGQDAVHI